MQALREVSPFDKDKMATLVVRDVSQEIAYVLDVCSMCLKTVNLGSLFLILKIQNDSQFINSTFDIEYCTWRSCMFRMDWYTC